MLVLMQQGDQSNMKDEVVSDSGSEVTLEVPKQYWEEQARLESIEKTLDKILIQSLNDEKMPQAPIFTRAPMSTHALISTFAIAPASTFVPSLAVQRLFLLFLLSKITWRLAASVVFRQLQPKFFFGNGQSINLGYKLRMSCL